MGVSFAALKSANPLRIHGTAMAPNLLLMCKIIAVAMLGVNHWRELPTPFLPFVPGLDQLVDPATFQFTLRIVFFVSAAMLLLNRCVRLSAFTLGSCLLLAVVSSKAYYGNNKMFCGLCLVLASISDREGPPYLLRLQFSIVYFGAALNKLIDPDWQSGVFFENWARNRLEQPVYIALADRLPPLVAGKIMCWGTALAELFMAVGVFVPRLVPWALWTHVLFQVGLLEFTGTTFNLFFFGMLAATLIFVDWPKEEEPPDGMAARLLYAPALWLVLTLLIAYPLLEPVLWRRVLVAAALLIGSVAWWVVSPMRMQGK